LLRFAISHRAARPLDDVRDEFDDGEPRLRAETRQRGAQREAHAVAADEQMRRLLVLKPIARQQRQRFFRAAEAARHQLIGTERDDEIGVALVEAQFVAARDLRCGEEFAGFHGEALTPPLPPLGGRGLG
jgi:hypothetical protein